MDGILILNEMLRSGRESGAGLMRNRCAFTSRDMAADWPEAFTYAVVFGWGDDDEPGAWDELAEKWGWDKELLDFLRDAHKRFSALRDRKH